MEKQTVIRLYRERIDLSKVEPGDKLTRMVGGEIPQPVIVGDMDDTHIWVGSFEGIIPATKEQGWKFRRDYGTEVDEEKGCDGLNVTLSYLTEFQQPETLDMTRMFGQDVDKKM